SRTFWMPRRWRGYLICSGSFATSMRFLRASSCRKPRKNPRPVPLAKNRSAFAPHQKFPRKKQRPGFRRGAVLTSFSLPLSRQQAAEAENCWDALKRAPTTSQRLLDALDVARFGGVHFDSIAFVHEGRHLHYQTGFQRGGLADRAGRGFLQRGLGVDHLEFHGVRQVHADWFFLEEFHLNDGVGNQVVDGFAELLAREMHLLVGFRVHEMEFVALVVEILEFDFVEMGAIDKFL